MRTPKIIYVGVEGVIKRVDTNHILDSHGHQLSHQITKYLWSHTTRHEGQHSSPGYEGSNLINLQMELQPHPYDFEVDQQSLPAQCPAVPSPWVPVHGSSDNILPWARWPWSGWKNYQAVGPAPLDPTGDHIQERSIVHSVYKSRQWSNLSNSWVDPAKGRMSRAPAVHLAPSLQIGFLHHVFDPISQEQMIITFREPVDTHRKTKVEFENIPWLADEWFGPLGQLYALAICRQPYVEDADSRQGQRRYLQRTLGPWCHCTSARYRGSCTRQREADDQSTPKECPARWI